MDAVADAKLADQVARARRWLRRRAWTCGVIAVGLVVLMVFCVNTYSAVTAWQSNIRDVGTPGRAVVVSVLDDSGKGENDRIVLQVVTPGQFSMSIDDISDIDVYAESATVDVWYDSSRQGRIATMSDVSSEGIEDWWAAAMALTFSGLVWMSLWAISALRSIVVARHHDFRWVEVSGLVVKDHGKNGKRTLLEFDDSDEPWTVRWHTPKEISRQVVIAGSGTRRLVATDRPFVVRQAKLPWTPRNWQRHLTDSDSRRRW